VKTTFSDF